MLRLLAPRLPCPALPVRARRSAPGLCQLGGLQLLDPELRGGTRPAGSYRPFSTRVPSAPGSTQGGPAPGPEYRGAGTPTGLWLGENTNLQLPLTGLPDLKLYWRRPGPAHREGSLTGRTVKLNPWSGAASRSCHLPPPWAKDLRVPAPKRTQGLLLPQSPASRGCSSLTEVASPSL